MPNKPKYPEHEKLAALNGVNETCGEFLHWLLGRYVFATYHRHSESCMEDGERQVCGAYADQLLPESFSIAALLAEFFEIDVKKLTEEKDAMLAELRAAAKP